MLGKAEEAIDGGPAEEMGKKKIGLRCRKKKFKTGGLGGAVWPALLVSNGSCVWLKRGGGESNG